MLSARPEFTTVAEVNPPVLPDMSHLLLEGAWSHVLVTDNVFGRIRVSPFAYAARVTHDVPAVYPTVVVSTRDRNILAIESEVRGAVGNGVDSFLAVVGDTLPTVDHYADHLEIVRHMRDLQSALPPFEIGMPTRFQSWQKRKRIEAGAQFLVAGPVLDSTSVERSVADLALRPEDPPLYLMVMPPFSLRWVVRGEGFGAVATSDGLKDRLRAMGGTADRRRLAWQEAVHATAAAKAAGCAGVVLMGLKYATIVDEAVEAWRSLGDPGSGRNRA